MSAASPQSLPPQTAAHPPVEPSGRPQSRAPAHAGQFACAEIWGGNRPADGAIELPGVRGYIYSRPCDGGRGGDIHYVSLCNSGLISRVCLADVAGHGETIAAVGGTIHGLLRQYMNSFDQRRVLADLNRQMDRQELGAMTTAVTVTLFPPSRYLSISYAGHPPAWFLRRSEGRWRLLDPREDVPSRRRVDLPLAVDPNAEFGRYDLRVRTGDRLLLLTDGVLEAPSPTGEQFGESRLARVLDQHRAAPLDELTRGIVQALCEHTGCPEVAHDDVTLLALEIVPGPPLLGLLHALKNRLFARRRGRA
ncbi:MAG: serine/threonine-protein phosphatase [Phycisphaerales bacterium]|nr:serine/threonine-protein phosphatase [Phycisphaerales bacterium]